MHAYFIPCLGPGSTVNWLKIFVETVTSVNMITQQRLVRYNYKIVTSANMITQQRLVRYNYKIVNSVNMITQQRLVRYNYKIANSVNMVTQQRFLNTGLPQRIKFVTTFSRLYSLNLCVTLFYLFE